MKKSIILSLSRQILFLLPALYFLPLLIEKTGNPDWNASMGVWLSFPISDLLSALLTGILLIQLFRKFNRLNDGDSSQDLGAQL